MHSVLWLAGALVLAIIEVLSVDFVFLMFSGGAAAAALAAACGAPLSVQVACFAVVSVILLAVLRPWMKNHLNRSSPRIRTNVHALYGQTAIVIETVTSEDGRVKLGGDIWSATSVSGVTIEKGRTVRVDKVNGATLLVSPYDITHEH